MTGGRGSWVSVSVSVSVRVSYGNDGNGNGNVKYIARHLSRRVAGGCAYACARVGVKVKVPQCMLYTINNIGIEINMH
jgi:hypothetical protein